MRFGFSFLYGLMFGVQHVALQDGNAEGTLRVHGVNICVGFIEFIILWEVDPA